MGGASGKDTCMGCNYPSAAALLHPHPTRSNKGPTSRMVGHSCTNSLQPSDVDMTLLLCSALKAREKCLPTPQTSPQAGRALQGFLKEGSYPWLTSCVKGFFLNKVIGSFVLRNVQNVFKLQMPNFVILLVYKGLKCIWKSAVIYLRRQQT